jgi:hypothetical protein
MKGWLVWVTILSDFQLIPLTPLKKCNILSYVLKGGAGGRRGKFEFVK